MAFTTSEPLGALVEMHEVVPDFKVAVHMVLEPTVKATAPVSTPTDAVTVAEKVTVWPLLATSDPRWLWWPSARGTRHRCGAPRDCIGAVTRITGRHRVEPAGALVEVHEALANLRVAVHKVLVPTMNVTEPVGVPDAEDTVAL